VPEQRIPDVVVAGLAFGESPRWRDGRLWVADWGAQEILTIAPGGAAEAAVRLELDGFQPLCFDWLTDGALVVVSSRRRALLRREADGKLTEHADLSRLFDQGLNEIVVDGRGNAYVNGFDLAVGEPFGPGAIALVRPAGSAERVADGLSFPNGMAVTPDNSTLLVAESYANRLTAFAIGPGGELADRRMWAETGDDHPDGICVDAEDAVWYGDVGNRRCVRILEGGEVREAIGLDRGCFACMLGGADGRDLFIVCQEWRGMDAIDLDARTGRVLVTRAPAPHAGWP
jgi:sugar lactone lactonase YvrE